MPKLTVGLAPYKNSFYDKKTNTSITLSNPVREISYNDNTDLLGLCHAVNCKFPALILYKGKFPKEVMDEWKGKYKLIAKQAINRADKNQEKSVGNDEGEAEEPEVLNIASIASLENIEVEFGTSKESLSLPSRVEVTFNDDSKENLNVTWNDGEPNYNGSSAGTYVFEGEIEISEELTNTDNLKAQITVNVLEEEEEEEGDVEALSFNLEEEKPKKKQAAKKTTAKKTTKKSTK